MDKPHDVKLSKTVYYKNDFKMTDFTNTTK